MLAFMNLPMITSKLREFYDKYKRLPTHGEMVKLFHYASRGSTHYLVKRLIQEGIVARDDYGKLVPKKLLSIPMYGLIKAGYPMPVDIQEDRNLDLHTLFSKVTGNSFALTVSGDSMKDEGINEGDIVVITKTADVHTGDIVAACVDGEWTVKYFHKENGDVVLMPANKNYKPIYPKNSLEIGGVVTHVIRQYRNV